MQNHNERISRWLSMILRHRAHERGVVLDAQGFADVSSLVRLSTFTEEDILNEAHYNDRFEVTGSSWAPRVRATYGITAEAYAAVDPVADARALPYLLMCSVDRAFVNSWKLPSPAVFSPTEVHDGSIHVEIRVADLIDNGVVLRRASEGLFVVFGPVPSRLFFRVVGEGYEWMASWAVTAVPSGQ